MKTLMITHYGLFWSERDVFWGRQKKTGTMLGREKTPLGRRGAPSKAERAKAKNYREYFGVYCLFGGGHLVYVGEAGLLTKRTIFDRLKDHRTGSLAGRWDQFSWFGRASIDGMCDVKCAFAQLEAAAIAITNPGHNKQSGTFQGATQVYQHPSDEAEGDIETKLERLANLVRQQQA